MKSILCLLLALVGCSGLPFGGPEPVGSSGPASTDPRRSVYDPGPGASSFDVGWSGSWLFDHGQRPCELHVRANVRYFGAPDVPVSVDVILLSEGLIVREFPLRSFTQRVMRRGRWYRISEVLPCRDRLDRVDFDRLEFAASVPGSPLACTRCGPHHYYVR